MDKEIAALKSSLFTASSILVVSHYNPDADAISSTCALSALLNASGKRVHAVNQDPIDQRYEFIAGSKGIAQPPLWKHYDLIVVCDAASAERVGTEVSQVIKTHPNVVNIDHHKSNTRFGTINIVIEDASSSCEVIFNIAKELQLAITTPIAATLLTGIVSDTGSFRYSNTSPATLRIAAELCDRGADIRSIAVNLFERKSKDAVLLQNTLLSNIAFHASGKIAWITALLKDLKGGNAHPDDLDPVVEEARTIEGVAVAVLVREQESGWRISLRAKDEAIDLAAIAKSLGGGGHRSAAGFSFQGTAKELQDTLLPKLTQMLS